MYSFIPILTFIILFAALARKEQCYRQAFLFATIIWGLITVGITEILSFFHALRLNWILCSWSLILVSSIIWYVRIFSRSRNQRKRTAKLSFKWFQESVPIPLLGGIIFIIFIVGITAFIAPPNTWDSMTYHMARVMHWIQNQTIAHYPTNFPPQLYHPPFAEFAIMHFQILTNNDYLANGVQWFSMVGCIVGVSLIGKELGANICGQVFAAVICATIPMGILQGSSTQNDYVVSIWLVCLAYAVLRIKNIGFSNSNLFLVSSSLSLALFTKTSSYFLIFPFFVWLIYLTAKKAGRIGLIKLIITLTSIVLIINGSHYTRNFQLSGSLLAAPINFVKEYKVEVFGIAQFCSNLIKNLTIHIATPLPSINRSLEEIVFKLHHFLGVPTFGHNATSDGFQINSLINHEDMAGAPIHLLLFFVIVVPYIIYSFRYYFERKKIKDISIIFYIAVILLAFVLFCVFLKYQPWNGRHHLAYLVLMSAPIGLIISRQRNFRIGIIIMYILLLSSIPWLFFNESRPLIANSQIIQNNRVENIFNTSRTQQYFFNRRYLESPYLASADFLHSINCNSIGLAHSSKGMGNNNLWEYPFWVILKEKFSEYPTIRHVNLANYSSKLSVPILDKNFNLCSIVYINDDSSVSEQIKVISGKKYVRAWSYQPLEIYIDIEKVNASTYF